VSGTLRQVPEGTLHSELRGQLERETDRLRRQIAELGGDDASLSYDENFADSGQVAAEQGETQALLNQLREQLAETLRALAKFEDGSYGACERCGKPIAEARLEAMPATRYCIDHA
jgi:RNA polymerase-binding transcription factor DksA